MKTALLLSSTVSVLLGQLATVHALAATDADLMWNSYNNVFLHRTTGSAYYQAVINSTNSDGSWTLASDIYVAEDVYRRKGDSATQSLVTDLCTGFIKNQPPAKWHGDSFNDDVAWFQLVLMRGYQITGNTSYLNYAIMGNDLVYQRGWNTTYNGGGIWWQQPEFSSNPNKQSLSNSPNALVACMIYQATHNQTHLDRCKTIYEWERDVLHNPAAGGVQSTILPNGTIDYTKTAFNQGVFVDVANLLWLITGNTTYYNDSALATDYGFQHITDKNQIFNDTFSGYDSWADLFARGAGNFMHDNNLWSTYYQNFVNNSNAIVQNRRMDLNITWNGWDVPTKIMDGDKTTHYVSAVAWLQYTPPINPVNQTRGLRTISNTGTGLFIESTGNYGTSQPVQLGTQNKILSENWLLTLSDTDNTYIIVNRDSWLALTATGSAATAISQAVSVRSSGQRWNIASVGNGLYSITNVLTGLALDAGTSTSAGAALTQTQYTGSASQQWSISTL